MYRVQYVWYFADSGCDFYVEVGPGKKKPPGRVRSGMTPSGLLGSGMYKNNFVHTIIQYAGTDPIFFVCTDSHVFRRIERTYGTCYVVGKVPTYIPILLTTLRVSSVPELAENKIEAGMDGSG